MIRSPFAPFFPSLPPSGSYLDSAAKTLTCSAALEAQQSFYSQFDCNIERGIYARSAMASDMVERARADVASLLGASPERISFSPSTTHALNSIALGLPWRPGMKVVTTMLEHHSNFLPWLALRRRGVEVVVLRASSGGFLDPDEMRRACRGAFLAAFTHASNVTGSVQDLEALAGAASSEGAFVVVDGAQWLSHSGVDIRSLPVDAYAFSGHKCFGPTGTGAVFISAELRRALEPAVLGGGSASDSSPEGFATVEQPPHRALEPGTQNIAGILGFGAAAAFSSGIDQDLRRRHMDDMASRCLDGLRSIGGLELHGPDGSQPRLPVFSFSVEGLSPHMLAMRLDQEYGVMTRSGNHCAPTLWRTLIGRSQGGVRASLHDYNCMADVDLLIDALGRLARDGGK